MPEYDAFGNPVDQAPLESGSAPASDVQPSDRPVQPAPVAPSPTPPPRTTTPPPSYSAPPQFRVSGGGSGSGRGLRIMFILLISIALPLGITYYVFNKADDTFNSVQKSFESFSKPTVFAPPPPTPDTPDTSATPPTGLDRGSLLLAGNFRPALREVRRLADGAGPAFVRVQADRIDVQVARNGKSRLIHRPWNAKAEVIGGTTPGASNQPTMRWSKVDAQAPRRLYEGVRNGSSRPSKQLEYAVLSAGFDRWSAFRENGTGFTADLRGRNLQRIGG